MADRGLSGQWLPIHSKPQPDELLSSWLTRLSLAHGMEYRIFCNCLWPTMHVWAKDIDWNTDEYVVTLLAQKTATTLPQASTTSFKDYEGWLFKAFAPNKYPPWLLLNSMQNFQRRLPAMQFCPECLSNDKQPYFRRHWRLGFVTLCTTHWQHLHGCCPCCQAPVNFHCLPRNTQNLAICYQCRFDLRLTPPQVLKDRPSYQRLWRFQAILLRSFVVTEYRLPSQEIASTYRFFLKLHQLAHFLTTHHRAGRNRAELCQQLGIENFHPHFLLRRRHAIEALSVSDRFRLMLLLVAWLDRYFTIDQAIAS